MKKIILTKKRLKALDLALSTDDILYEKFRRLEEKLNHDIKNLYHPKKRIVQVIKKGENYNEIIQVKDVIQTGEGFIVYI